MKYFKRTKEKIDVKVAQTIKSLFAWIRLMEKINRANSWAAANKKRASVITVSLLFLSLVLGSWLTLTASQNEASMLTGITAVGPNFDGMHRIQRVKEMQVEQTTEMTNCGQRLKHELDSLVALPCKSHKDSVDIVVKYKQLELVVNYLDNK